jgi:hypothetical protein
MTVYLEKITVRFPDTDTDFTRGLTSLIDTLGYNENGVLRLTHSSQGIYPEISLDFQSGCSDMMTDFTLTDGEIFSVKIENTTGISKQSPYSYKHLGIETVSQRLVCSGIRLTGIDHVGFNLPWFSSGLHPRILQLREKLSAHCLYHRFPTGEPWDFIIPGDNDEIDKCRAVDYTKVRRPKFELVSFGNASTPLIQLDVSVDVDYESFSPLFPEALHDPSFRNLWVYLETPYAIDVCLVINRFPEERDWSSFFEGFRL